MLTKQELLAWVETIPDESSIAICSGGLNLVEVDSNGVTSSYLEVGGVPDMGEADSTWQDPDDAPPLPASWFDKAELRNGDEVIRPAS